MVNKPHCKGDLHSLILRSVDEIGPEVIHQAFVCKHCGYVPEIKLIVADETGTVAAMFGQPISDG